MASGVMPIGRNLLVLVVHTIGQAIILLREIYSRKVFVIANFTLRL